MEEMHMPAKNLTLAVPVGAMAAALALTGALVRGVALDAAQHAPAAKIAPAAKPAATMTRTIPEKTLVERGAYLVRTMGCNDCHTPLKMGPRGPEPDMSRALTGHPQDLVMPPAPVLPPGPWTNSFSATNTAWAGPGA
jgi:hypothetical protein